MSATIVHQPWLLVGQRVPPGISLNLSFMTPGTLDPSIVFTRASTGTYFDSTGTLQTAAVNAPRWDYDPVAHTLNGLLIEEQRTNSVLNSGDASNASWTKTAITVAAPVVTANQTTAPDGTLTAARVVLPAVSSAGNASLLTPLAAAATAAAYSVSIWAKGSVGGEQVYLFATTTATIYYRIRITLTTTWQRFVITTPNLTTAGWNYVIGTDLRDVGQTATSAMTIFVWGAQVELGAFPTSYIPTTAASVTRSADVCTMPTAAWFNTTASSLAADFTMPQSPNPSATSRDVCSLSDGTSSNRMILRGLVASANTALFSSVASGTVGASTSLGVVTAGAVSKIAAAWNGVTPAGVLNGGAAVTYSGGQPVGINILGIGNQAPPAGAPLNGWVRRVRYWPRALSASELQSVTR